MGFNTRYNMRIVKRFDVRLLGFLGWAFVWSFTNVCLRTWFIKCVFMFDNLVSFIVTWLREKTSLGVTTWVIEFLIGSIIESNWLSLIWWVSNHLVLFDFLCDVVVWWRILYKWIANKHFFLSHFKIVNESFLALVLFVDWLPWFF